MPGAVSTDEPKQRKQQDNNLKGGNEMKNQKKAFVDQGKRIVLKYNEDVTGAACYF